MQPQESSGVGPLFAAKMAQSLLDADCIKKLKFKPRSRAEPAPIGIPSPAAGFTIPYFDLSGKPTDFWRYRYLENPDVGSFDAVTEHKALRYVQPPGSLNELYIPPLIDWAGVAKDATHPLIITEGELKSACATAHTEFPTIGLGGVWSFRSGRNRLALLPLFREFSWEKRKVYIAYDSDAATNPKVLEAQNALARELLQLGAYPYIARLPAKSNQKVGLDDFIVAEGSRAVARLLKQASLFAEASELHDLNEEVIYVKDPGLIVRFETGQRLAPRAFADHAYSTRRIIRLVDTPKGGRKAEEKSAAKEWLKWGHRNEVERMAYTPAAPYIHNGTLNTWPGWGCEPKRGDVGPWKELLNHLFGGRNDYRQWFERWCAYPLQFPGFKMYSSAVMQGRLHGTGKSFVGYSLFKIYGANATEIKDANLRQSHNGWAENKQFIMGDEIAGGEAKRELGDQMKSIITQQKIIINQKYVPTYELLDCINYYFTSNHPDAFFLEDDDRRMFVWEVKAEPLPRSFYRKYEAWIGAPGVVGPGGPALFHHLLNLDLGDFDARGKALDTPSKQDMLRLGRSDLGMWVAALAESPDSVLKIGDQVCRHAIYRTEDLLNMYDPERRTRVTINGLARELRRHGFQQAYGGQGVPTKKFGQVRLWVIRPIDAKIASTSKAGVYFDKERELPGAKYATPEIAKRARKDDGQGEAADQAKPVARAPQNQWWTKGNK